MSPTSRNPTHVPGLVAHWPVVGRWSPETFATEPGAVRVTFGARGQVVERDLSFSDAIGHLRSPARGQVVAIAAHRLTPSADIATPAGAAGLTPFLWIGPAGKIVPLHRDGDSGLLCGVSGWKRVELVAPERVSGGPINPAVAVTSAAPDLVVELAPGDGLWIPAGWWHRVEYCTDAVSVNFWPGDYLDPAGRPLR